MVEIIWYGHACFRLRDKNTVVITDPYSRALGYSLPRVRTDIVTISLPHPHHASLEAVKGQPKVISGPGEYEIQGIFITGIRFPNSEKPNKTELRNTAYLFEFEGLTVCHLGGLTAVPTPAQVEGLSAIDVLLLPVGGGKTIGAGEAAEVISLLEPRVVVPMHFRTGVGGEPELASVDKFLKVMGVRAPTPQESLKMGRISPDAVEETQVVVLAPKGLLE